MGGIMGENYEAEVNGFLALVDPAKSIVIKDADSDARACEIGKKVNGELKRLDELKKSMTDPINQSLKRIRALFAPAEEAGEKYLRSIKDAHNGFVMEEQRKARAEEARLAEIARKQAEELKEKAKDEAFAGNVEVAQDLEQQAEETETLVPTVQANVRKVEAVAMKTYWSAEVIDFNLVPREYLVIDQKKINALAVATKGPSSIPGVKFVSRQDASFGKS